MTTAVLSDAGWTRCITVRYSEESGGGLGEVAPPTLESVSYIPIESAGQISECTRVQQARGQSMHAIEHELCIQCTMYCIFTCTQAPYTHPIVRSWGLEVSPQQATTRVPSCKQHNGSLCGQGNRLRSSVGAYYFEFRCVHKCGPKWSYWTDGFPLNDYGVKIILFLIL